MTAAMPLFAAETERPEIAPLAPVYGSKSVSVPLAKPETVRAWTDKRFGLFIHWGPVSLTGQAISWSRKGPRAGCDGMGWVPNEEYDNLYKRFNPVKFNADQWIQVDLGKPAAINRATD